jgi:hypothetical protein
MNSKITNKTKTKYKLKNNEQNRNKYELKNNEQKQNTKM